MATDLPAPPLPATVDLRDFSYMPLDVARLRDAELTVVTKGDEFRCAVLLWCAAWHQVPAGSLPDDDALLAQLAGFGRVVKEWRKVKAGALRGFTRCNDGRLYHAVVVEKALEAWRVRLTQRWKTECARVKKQAQRTKADLQPPAFSLWITRECPEATPYLSLWTDAAGAWDTHHESPGQPPIVPRETASKGSEGKGSSSNTTGVNGGSSAPAHPAAGGTVQPQDPAMFERILAECARAKLEDPTVGNPTIAEWWRMGANPAQVAAALVEARRARPMPQDLEARYVNPIVERIVKADQDARAAVDARLQRTQATIAEGKAAEATRVPPPPDLVKRYARKAAA